MRRYARGCAISPPNRGASATADLHVFLRHEGYVVNRKKTQRLYREEGLSVRRRRGRKRATGTRAPLLVETRPNARWSIDFVHDQFGSGPRFRVLNIIDDVTKECLAAIPDTSISGRRVARELAEVIRRRGKPDLVVSDHGTEFTSNAMLAWTQAAGVTWHFIAPGQADAERHLRSLQRPHAR